jgi:hypothetical protein
MKHIIAFVIAVIASQSVGLATEAPQALPGAHAHNDYYHQRPLFDALERGFVSIEADVFLVDGELLVGHYAHELKPERSLELLYLAPLRKHIESNDGRVFAGDERLTLLVDVKTDGPAAYAALDKLLEKYDNVLSTRLDGKPRPGPLQVIVTGNRPIKAIAADGSRRVAVDGRLADLQRKSPQELFPLVSESWTSHFKWRGVGPMPTDERARLRQIAEQVLEKNSVLRFWATPDAPAVWSELQAAGVDVIGADDLEALQKFLTK